MKDRRYWLVAAAALLVTGTLLRADIISTLPYTFTNGQVIDAGQFNANFSAIVTGVNSNAATAGANSNITSLTGLTTALTPSVGGSSRFYASASATGTANTVVVAAVTPNNYSLVAGYEVSFQSSAVNNGNVTLAVAGTTAKSVIINTGSGPSLLLGGEIGSDARTTVVYDGSNYRLMNPVTPPVGSIQDFAGAVAPGGWLVADGSSLLRATYPSLFTVIGTTYGAADGSHFSLPDLRGRMTVALDSGANRITTATCSAPSTLGTGCGAQNYTVAQANLPNVAFTVSGITLNDPMHAHTIPWFTSASGSGSPFFSSTYQNNSSNATVTTTSVSTGITISNQGTAASGGSGTALPALNPVMVLNKIIKY